MKLQVLVAGVARDLSRTLKSLDRFVVGPARALGWSVDVSGSIGFAAEIQRNPRNTEGRFPSTKIPRRFLRGRVLIFSAYETDLQTELLFQRAMKNGDPWPVSGGRSLRNFLGLLYLEHRSVQLVDFEADLLMVVRADLELQEEFSISKYADEALRGTFVVPRWHAFGGVNDRLALLSPPSSRVYLDRWLLVDDYLDLGRPLHAETFLAWSLRDHRVDSVIEERVSRLRVGVLSGSNRLREDFSK